MQRSSKTFMTLALLTSLAGCDKTLATVAESASAIGDDGERQTVGSYAEGFNAMLEASRSCIDDYAEKVPETGPEPGKDYHFFNHCARVEYDVVKAKTAFDAAASSAPDALKPLAKP